MGFASVCQLIGGMFLTFASVPQIKHLHRTKQTEGVSITTYYMLLTGNTLMLIYATHLTLIGVGATLLITTIMGTVTIATVTAMLKIYSKK